MSKYTSEVRFICENYAGLVDSVGYNSTKNVIATARKKVFDFDYPIFDENYRPVLETKILKHFYTREIGAESVGLWKLWLDSRLNEIMPYYNKLYESELLEFNPLYEVDLTTDHKKNVKEDGKENGSYEVNKSGTTEGTGETHSTGEASQTGGNKVDRWEYFSDTPQGSITGLQNLDYLTNATHTTDNGLESSMSSDNSTNADNEYSENTTGNEVGSNNKTNILNNTEDYLEHVKGKTAGTSYSKLLQEYRQTFINIDMQVINDLNDLFMNLW